MSGVRVRHGLGLVLLALLFPLAACGSSEPSAHESPTPVPAKICGLFDRDRVVALGLDQERIRATGEITDRATRLEHDLTCTVRDGSTGHQVVRVVLGDLDPGEVEKATDALDDEYAVKRNDGGTLICSRPDALNSVGTGYACRSHGLVTVAAVVPGRLVRLTYHPLLDEPHAAAFARAIGLISNLQENVVAFDLAHPTESPSPSS